MTKRRDLHFKFFKIPRTHEAIAAVSKSYWDNTKKRADRLKPVAMKYLKRVKR